MNDYPEPDHDEHADWMMLDLIKRINAGHGSREIKRRLYIALAAELTALSVKKTERFIRRPF